MDIRLAEEKDIAQILGLLVQVDMVHHEGRPDLFKGPATKYDAKQLKEILSEMDKPVFVAVNGEEVLGYLMASAEVTEESALRTGIKTFYIDDLCIDEKYRGMHIGSALYKYGVDYAKKNGFHNITLHAWQCNKRAVDFYKYMGMNVQYICFEEIL